MQRTQLCLLSYPTYPRVVQVGWTAALSKRVRYSDEQPYHASLHSTSGIIIDRVGFGEGALLAKTCTC